ncbi:hypothetical protein MesoLj131a_62290 [Mesorhizobium sp. 131-2-1]|nr:hypothetical protein MesoLj131a_62290 [Mesorhizobium sp. 131-2-1]BCH04436.1 hypothetical protein MesoLj131b_64350 [Mesorhizobium sp. 131-2-5]
MPSPARDDALPPSGLMELEAGATTGADHGEKSARRTAQCNGYRERDWKTRPGTGDLRIPKLTAEGPLHDAGNHQPDE